MTGVTQLIQNYQKFIKLEWKRNLPGCQKVLFAIYPPVDERKIRAQLLQFKIATLDANRTWYHIDISSEPARFISNHEYAQSYFESPDAVESLEEDIRNHIAYIIKEQLLVSDIDENSVVAVTGVSSLFGFTHISPIVSMVDGSIKGRLLIFFPGIYEKGQYRFMDARTGFDYMAIPITCDDGGFS
jgi:hypothetical protein